MENLEQNTAVCRMLRLTAPCDILALKNAVLATPPAATAAAPALEDAAKGTLSVLATPPAGSAAALMPDAHESEHETQPGWSDREWALWVNSSMTATFPDTADESGSPSSQTVHAHM